MGHKIDGVHPFSFEVVGNTYAKDLHHVFQYGQIIDGLNPFGFQPPTQQMNSTMNFAQPFAYPMQMPSYVVKGFNVFFGQQIVSDAQWVGFKDLGNGYGLLCFFSRFVCSTHF